MLQFRRTPARLAAAAAAAGAVTLAGATIPAAASAATRPATASSPSLLGTWHFEGGLFKFVRNKKGEYVDVVIKRRPDAVCASKNDRNGHIALRKTSALGYTGKWEWFYTSCASAGWGKTVITLSKSGAKAHVVANAPAGTGAPTSRFWITRDK
jgi:hypothetical protein